MVDNIVNIELIQKWVTVLIMVSWAISNTRSAILTFETEAVNTTTS